VYRAKRGETGVTDLGRLATRWLASRARSCYRKGLIAAGIWAAPTTVLAYALSLGSILEVIVLMMVFGVPLRLAAFAVMKSRGSRHHVGGGFDTAPIHDRYANPGAKQGSAVGVRLEGTVGSYARPAMLGR
jgi:hypothetical protein